jgi:hypothetical protein
MHPVRFASAVGRKCMRLDMAARRKAHDPTAAALKDHIKKST